MMNETNTLNGWLGIIHASLTNESNKMFKLQNTLCNNRQLETRRTNTNAPQNRFNKCMNPKLLNFQFGKPINLCKTFSHWMLDGNGIILEYARWDKRRWWWWMLQKLKNVWRGGAGTWPRNRYHGNKRRNRWHNGCLTIADGVVSKSWRAANW